MLRYNPRLLAGVGSGPDRVSESETLQSSKRFAYIWNCFNNKSNVNAKIKFLLLAKIQAA